MCGIAGILNYESSLEALQKRLIVMQRALRHRGPDAEDLWIDKQVRFGFAHTRLSILDLSPTGSQPMVCRQTGAALTFNGEIYNYLELRERLETKGIRRWKGSSDTEVLFELLKLEGLDGLNLIDGMFAFAFYNPADESLILARDHIGEKQLYYSLSGRKITGFASETQALQEAGLGGTKADQRGIALLLRKGSIPPPLTHFEDIRALRPGAMIKVDLNTGSWDEKHYWHHPYRNRSSSNRRTVTNAEVWELRRTIQRSFSRRMRADVTVGAFLSGGIDSSFVCARLIEAGLNNLETFTVVMPGQPGDESAQAREISKRLGTNHHEIPLDVGESLEWLDSALDAMDVPSVDGPNTWLVSRAVARQGLKVACSGLGGDELFYGYPSFAMASKVGTIFPLLKGFSRLTKPLSLLVSNYAANPKVQRLAGSLIDGADWAALWLMRRGIFAESELQDFLALPIASTAERTVEELIAPDDHLKRQNSALELQVYMHDQLLRDTDVMSMSHALEVRVPLIGREIVEIVSSLPATWISGNQPKWFLREWLKEDGLGDLFDRPKQGFILNWPKLWTDYLNHRPPSQTPELRAERVRDEHHAFLTGDHHYSRSFTLETLGRKLTKPS